VAANSDAALDPSNANDANHVSQKGDSLNYDNSYGNLVLIISFCLFALIVHHIYNSNVVND